MKPPRSVLVRDAIIFMLKLWLDGLKDVVLTFTAMGALVIDFARAKSSNPYLFYKVVRAGERFDLWLNLYSASKTGGQNLEGFFGTSKSGADTLLGKLEELSGGERKGGGPPKR